MQSTSPSSSSHHPSASAMPPPPRKEPSSLQAELGSLKVVVQTVGSDTLFKILKKLERDQAQLQKSKEEVFLKKVTASSWIEQLTLKTQRRCLEAQHFETSFRIAHIKNALSTLFPDAIPPAVKRTRSTSLSDAETEEDPSQEQKTPDISKALKKS